MSNFQQQFYQQFASAHQYNLFTAAKYNLLKTWKVQGYLKGSLERRKKIQQLYMSGATYSLASMYKTRQNGSDCASMDNQTGHEAGYMLPQNLKGQFISLPSSFILPSQQDSIPLDKFTKCSRIKRKDCVMIYAPSRKLNTKSMDQLSDKPVLTFYRKRKTDAYKRNRRYHVFKNEKKFIIFLDDLQQLDDIRML